MIDPNFREYPPSYHVSTADSHPSYPTFEGRPKTETCIIDGDLTDLCIALPSAGNGHEVIALEAARIGFGVSGRGGGQITSDFACSMEEIEKQIGLEQAQRFWQQSLQAVELVDSHIQKYSIQCDWQRDYAAVAVHPQHWEELQQWHKHAQRHYNASHYQIWNETTLRQQLANDRHQDAQFDLLSDRLHPLNYILGIVKAAAGTNVQLFEQSPMTRIRPCDSDWLIHTPDGNIEYENPVYAVNVYASLHPKFRVLGQKAVAVNTSIVAAKPLGERAKDLVRNDMAIRDSHYILDCYRLSAGGYLLFGGKDNGFIDDPDHMIEFIRQDVLKVLPQFASVRIEYSWGGEYDITRNLAPRLGHLTPTVFPAQSYSGHGMVTTNIASLAIIEAIVGDGSRLKSFEQLRHSNTITRPFLRKLGSYLGSKYYRRKDSR